MRHPSARIVIRPARVQGDDAPADLVRALRAIVQVPELDVVIIGRGGGSAEDLRAFNDEALARAIAACPVPVIAAVGHEVDFTIADFVADVRAATPSNAAELVVERADHVRARIDRAAERLARALERTVDARLQQHDRLDLRLRQWPSKIHLRERDRQDLDSRISRALLARLAAARERFEALRRRLDRRDVRRVTAELRARTAQADARLRAAVMLRRHGAERHAATLAATARRAQPAGRAGPRLCRVLERRTHEYHSLARPGAHGRSRPRHARRGRVGLPRGGHRKIVMTQSIKDFESAIAELEKIVKQLEDGDLALDKSLALFERGVELSRYCHDQLGAAERRIELLSERGKLTDASHLADADDER